MKLNSVLISIWGKIVLSSVYISVIVFLIVTSIVVGVAFVFDHYNTGFGVNVLVEAHGMLFDILVIGVFILALNKLSEKRIENQRYLAEIDDFRGWKSKEAAFRIVGNIKRLNRNGFRGEINLSECHLAGVNLAKAKLTKAGFYGANLNEANLRKVRGLNIDQLLNAKSLYKAKLDPELMELVREKCPQLLEKPKEE